MGLQCYYLANSIYCVLHYLSNKMNYYKRLSKEDVKKKFPLIITDDRMLEQYKVNCLKLSNGVNLLILDIDLCTLITA